MTHTKTNNADQDILSQSMAEWNVEENVGVQGLKVSNEASPYGQANVVYYYFSNPNSVESQCGINPDPAVFNPAAGDQPQTIAIKQEELFDSSTSSTSSPNSGSTRSFYDLDTKSTEYKTYQDPATIPFERSQYLDVSEQQQANASSYDYDWVPQGSGPTTGQMTAENGLCHLQDGRFINEPVYINKDNKYVQVQPYFSGQELVNIEVDPVTGQYRIQPSSAGTLDSTNFAGSDNVGPYPSKRALRCAAKKTRHEKNQVTNIDRNSALAQPESFMNLAELPEEPDFPELELSDRMLNIIRGDVHPNKFPKKIWLLATDSRFTPITWNSRGNGILINERLMKPNVLEKLFRSNKIASFLRQLHLYDFTKVNRARSCNYVDETGKIVRVQMDYISEYARHSDFLQSDQSKVKNITRVYRPAKKPVKRGFLFTDEDDSVY